MAKRKPKSKRPQRQGNHAPGWMGGQPRQRDPIVSIQPLVASGSGSGIVMDAGTFHVLSVTRSGRVIQAECDALDQTGSELVHHESEHDGGKFFGYPSKTDEAIVEAVPIVMDSGGDEPGAGGTAIVGEEHAGDDDGQTKGDSNVQAGLQPRDGVALAWLATHPVWGVIVY